jgi:hypothetical protein
MQFPEFRVGPDRLLQSMGNCLLPSQFKAFCPSVSYANIKHMKVRFYVLVCMGAKLGLQPRGKTMPGVWKQDVHDKTLTPATSRNKMEKTAQ